MPSFTVEAAQRLDKFIMERLKLSRSRSQNILEHGLLRVNGQTVTLKAKGRILEPGDRVDLAIHTVSDLEKIKPVNLSLKLLHVEEGFVVVDKPTGMPVLPQSHLESHSVLNDLAYRFPELQGIGEAGLRSGVVHRLDNNTSGVLVVARQEGAWQKLRKAFKTHEAGKRYYALVHGQLMGEGELKNYLAITQHSPARVKVVTANHKAARLCNLHWLSVATFKDTSLLEIELGTGFLHQIRVMMAHLGHPILADNVYGQTISKSFNCSRQMLHASSITILGLTVKSDFPTDFKACLDSLSSLQRSSR